MMRFLNTDCLVHILGFFQHTRGLSIAAMIGLKKEFLNSVDCFVFSCFKELRDYAHYIPQSHRFHHIIFDFQPETHQLKHIQNLIQCNAWSGEKITFSFLWHRHGLLYASSVCSSFESIDVTVVTREMSSPGHGGLNCVFNLLSTYDGKDKELFICFQKGRYTQHSVITEEEYVASWPCIRRVSFSHTAVLDAACRNKLEKTCPNAIILTHQ
jgi:hypothetical protein